MSSEKIKVGRMLSFGYFRNAQLSLEYILNEKNIGKILIPKKNNINGYQIPFNIECGMLFIAARFNFKHGLEISMKYLLQNAEKKIPITHKLNSICDKIERELVNSFIFSKTFDAWKWIIDKYYVGDKFAPMDNNELDKYMFSQNGDSFPYKNIHYTNKKDIKIFLRDIKTAKNLFYKMIQEYDLIKYCEKFNLNVNREQKKSKIIICKSKKSGEYFIRTKSGVTKSKMLDD